MDTSDPVAHATTRRWPELTAPIRRASAPCRCQGTKLKHRMRILSLNSPRLRPIQIRGMLGADTHNYERDVTPLLHGHRRRLFVNGDTSTVTLPYGDSVRASRGSEVWSNAQSGEVSLRWAPERPDSTFEWMEIEYTHIWSRIMEHLGFLVLTLREDLGCALDICLPS